MEEQVGISCRGNGPRVCTRPGCINHVKKRTAKYCSVGCCAADPARQQRLRVQARRSSRRTVLPMVRQLALGLPDASNPEEQIAMLCDGREDLPRGMSRLVG